VAVILMNLAEVHVARGAPDQALPLARRALAIAEKVYGPRHAETAAVSATLGKVFVALRDWDAAAGAAERALAIAGEAGDAGARADALVVLANAWWGADRRAKARTAALEALELRRAARDREADAVQRWLDEHPSDKVAAARGTDG
jgi:tetratricopeptide (TPR) repeat protein